MLCLSFIFILTVNELYVWKWWYEDNDDDDRNGSDSYNDDGGGGGSGVDDGYNSKSLIQIWKLEVRAEETCSSNMCIAIEYTSSSPSSSSMMIIAAHRGKKYAKWRTLWERREEKKSDRMIDPHTQMKMQTNTCPPLHTIHASAHKNGV